MGRQDGRARLRLPPGRPRAAETIKLNTRFLLQGDFQAVALPALAIHGKDQVMSKRENDANNTFRQSDRPLTEYEKEQIALRKNMERLKAERLAREKAKSKEA
jgi:hypothetical protein